MSLTKEASATDAREVARAIPATRWVQLVLGLIAMMSISSPQYVWTLFVAPFQGILRTDALHAAGSTLDVAAVVAFVGWTILELIVIWAVAIFRREPA